ncbi:EamA family transporter [Clostridium tyrobutyricum]|nr:EamA family transporter [Clostridium tyrobutyricum]MBV4418383.1 EamA family transporter [Clostridium tyrobutyricum]
MSSFFDSYKKNIYGILLIFIASLLTSFGQMFWKLSYQNSRYLLFIGFICYGLGALLMIVAFKHGSFSVLHPMLSLSYIFAIFLGIIVIKETVDFIKLLGILFIMSGVVLIGGGDN